MCSITSIILFNLDRRAYNAATQSPIQFFFFLKKLEIRAVWVLGNWTVCKSKLWLHQSFHLNLIFGLRIILPSFHVWNWSSSLICVRTPGVPALVPDCLTGAAGLWSCQSFSLPTFYQFAMCSVIQGGKYNFFLSCLCSY